MAAVWLALFVAGSASLREATSAPWPYGLGTVGEALAREHPTAMSPEAARVQAAIDRLHIASGVPRSALESTNVETALGDDGSRPLSPSTAAAVADPMVHEIAEEIVSDGDRIVWGDGGSAPASRRLRGVANFAQILGASALVRGNPHAWNDAQAMWIVARSLGGTSDPFTKRLSLDLLRRANAIARKLPPPVPAWVAEIAASEPRRDLVLEIRENAVARVKFLHAQRYTPAGIFFGGLRDLALAGYTQRNLHIAEALASSPRCRVSPGSLDAAMQMPGWNLTARNAPRYDRFAYRADRIDAELEATQKVLALKTARARLGHWPETLPGIDASRCSDNHWLYQVAPDGSMSLKMSWEVSGEPGATVAPALQFQYPR